MSKPRLCGLVLCVLLFTGASDAAAPPVDGRALLDLLLVEHRKHGLPLPPKGARLIRFSRPQYRGENARSQPVHVLAFLVEDSGGKTPARFVCGLYTYRADEIVNCKPIAPEAAAARVCSGGLHENLLFALQCHSLGWTALAKECGSKRSRKYKPATLPTLLFDAWFYWSEQIPIPGSDRAADSPAPERFAGGGQETDKGVGPLVGAVFGGGPGAEQVDPEAASSQ